MSTFLLEKAIYGVGVSVFLLSLSLSLSLCGERKWWPGSAGVAVVPMVEGRLRLEGVWGSAQLLGLENRSACLKTFGTGPPASNGYSLPDKL